MNQKEIDLEEILNSKLTYGKDTYDAGQRDNIVAAMREAVRQALEMAAEKAKMSYHGEMVHGEYHSYPDIDKKSITSIMDKIK